MNRIVCTALAMGLLLATTGCAHNALVGHQSTRVGVFFGDYGIKGNGNNLTAQSGSRLTKVSFFGNDNTVMIEDNVTLPHVEFWGNNNVISVPQALMIRVTEVGAGNRVIRREPTWALETESDRLYLPPEERPPPSPAEAEWGEPVPADKTPSEEADAQPPADEPAEEQPANEPP